MFQDFSPTARWLTCTRWAPRCGSGRRRRRVRAELEAGIAGASAAVITLTERVDAELLAAAGPQLKVIANVAVGFDNIDLSAAEAAGVTVTNTPASSTAPPRTTPSR